MIPPTKPAKTREYAHVSRGALVVWLLINEHGWTPVATLAAKCGTTAHNMRYFTLPKVELGAPLLWSPDGQCVKLLL